MPSLPTVLTALDTANFHRIRLPGQPSGLEGGVRVDVSLHLCYASLANS